MAPHWPPPIRVASILLGVRTLVASPRDSLYCEPSGLCGVYRRESALPVAGAPHLTANIILPPPMQKRLWASLAKNEEVRRWGLGSVNRSLTVPLALLLLAPGLSMPALAGPVPDYYDGHATAVPRNYQPCSLCDNPLLSDPPPTSHSHPSGPQDHYKDNDTGKYYYYDGTTVTEDPLYVPSDDLHRWGINITFVERGDPLVGGATCEQTFCVEYFVRVVGDYDVTWRYNYTGKHRLTGRPIESWGGSEGSVTINNGRPLVTGGGVTKSQFTSVVECEVVASLQLTHRTLGKSRYHQETFECVKS